MSALLRTAVAVFVSMPATLLVMSFFAWRMPSEDTPYADVVRILVSALLAGPIVLGVLASASHPRVANWMSRFLRRPLQASLVAGMTVGLAAGLVMAVLVPGWALGFSIAGLIFGFVHGWLIGVIRNGDLLSRTA